MNGRGSNALRNPVETGVVDLLIRRVEATRHRTSWEHLAVEEPLEIRIEHGPLASRQRASISVTMRTPGADVELAVGFLFAEGLIGSATDLVRAAGCGPASARGVQNVVRVELAPHVRLGAKWRPRNFVSNSACGLCGKASLEALAPAPRVSDQTPLALTATLVHALPAALRQTQSVFDRTGGLHAAALFDAHGRLVDVQEDIGRHNAVDKLIGARVLERAVPLSEHAMLVSGRAGYELVQKALVAGIPILAAVGAPSSIAADLARSRNMTLLGFVRDGRFNVYTRADRISGTLPMAPGDLLSAH
jgi:FdhD protein